MLGNPAPSLGRPERYAMNLLAGLIALATALGYVGVLAFDVNLVPLWIVILIGVAAMVMSFVETVRGDTADR